jgi:hypothetical protein
MEPFRTLGRFGQVSRAQDAGPFRVGGIRSGSDAGHPVPQKPDAVVMLTDPSLPVPDPPAKSSGNHAWPGPPSCPAA